jgi:hypothetical protein
LLCRLNIALWDAPTRISKPLALPSKYCTLGCAGVWQAGMALCALNLKDTEAAKGLVDTLKRDYPKDLEDPIVKQAINAVSIVPLP